MQSSKQYKTFDEYWRVYKSTHTIWERLANGWRMSTVNARMAYIGASMLLFSMTCGIGPVLLLLFFDYMNHKRRFDHQHYFDDLNC